MNQNEDTTVDTERYNGRLMNNVVRYPLLVERALGPRIHNHENDRWMLDFWGDEGVCSLGYNTPEVLQAVMSFWGTGEPHQLPDIYPHKLRWEAAQLLCERTGMERCFFANSGTEANEAAIKIARKYWWDKGDEKRYKILTMEGNFHGRTGLSLAAGDFRVSPYHRHGFGPIAAGFGVMECSYKTDKSLGGEFIFHQVATDGSEHANREPEWDQVAAIILAPVLGNNTVLTYPSAFWQELDGIRKRHGVLLIYDDVQAGSGRAGYHATWQHPNIQVRPDIMTLAKGIAMGFPMSCMLSSLEVSKSFTPGVHFNTFGGSPFVCHMAVEMIDWLDAHLPEVRERGELIRETLNGYDWVKSVDGFGMLNAFTPWYEEYGYDGFAFVHKARDFGLLLATHRKLGPIRFTPPLNIYTHDLKRALGALHATHVVLAG